MVNNITYIMLIIYTLYTFLNYYKSQEKNNKPHIIMNKKTQIIDFL